MIPLKKSYQSEITQRRVRSAPKNTQFKIEDYLFPEQLRFVNDPSLNKIAICSRRAGKSTAVAADLVLTAFTYPECTALYVTGSRSDAKKIIWREILKFNRVHKLGGVPNISELTLAFPNESVVRLHGAKDEGEIDKIRGQLPPIKKVFVDEAQKIRDSILTQLIDDVLEPALLDYGAAIALLGTPGSIPTGYFYRMAHNLKEDGTPLPTPVWSAHTWTFFNNPFIAQKSKTTHQELLARVLKRRGLLIDDPTIQREYFGKWTLDIESLLIRYDAKKNHYDELPTFKTPWNYILGIDLGFDDADALAVLAWHESTPVTYLVHEEVTTGQGITELVTQVQALQRQFDISKMVIDQGGLGKKIAEEIRRQYQIPVVGAEKSRKMEHVKFMNDALRTGRLMAKQDSRFAQDSYLVEIDRDKSTPDKIKVSDKFHSDICFSGDTLVKTIHGDKRIDKITTDDLVLTRNGYFKVDWVGQTGVSNVIELIFSDGTTLKCTENHPIYCFKTNQFIQAGSLKLGFIPYKIDICAGQRVGPRLSYSTGLGSLDIPMPSNHLTGTITQDVFGNVMARSLKSVSYIARFGNIIKGQFQRASKFITWTTTHSITNLKTLRCFPRLVTCANTGYLKVLERVNPTALPTSIKSGHLQNIGMGRLRGLNGIAKTQKNIFILSKQFAVGVIKAIRSLTFVKTKMDVARVNVLQQSVVPAGWMTLKQSVNYVGPFLRRTNTLKSDSVDTLVPQKIKMHIKNWILSRPFAQYVKKVLKKTTTDTNFAAESVTKEPTHQKEKYLNWLRLLANGAGLKHQRTNTIKRSSVVVLVQQKEIMQENVYNLRVKNGPPEFFANNILVHNCDSVLYSFVASPAFGFTPAIEKPKSHTAEWYKAQEDEMWESTVDQMKRESANAGVDDPWQKLMRGEL